MGFLRSETYAPAEMAARGRCRCDRECPILRERRFGAVSRQSSRVFLESSDCLVVLFGMQNLKVSQLSESLPGMFLR